jgi:riboflavin kinase/FMN adenylyltransferase
VVLAFGMPPRVIKKQQRAPVLLTTLSDKIQILKRLGVDRIKVLVFNRATASTPPEKFFVNTVIRQFGARDMVVGPRVAFGKNRAGRLGVLRRLGRQYGVRIHVTHRVKASGEQVSSSRIRSLLISGEVEKAWRFLGHPYSVSGKVVSGAHRGHRLGYPTANISVDTLKILPPGVFWVKVYPGDRPIPWTSRELAKGVDGLCNVGTRPTFEPAAKKLHCEVFLLHKPSSRLYGRNLRVIFLRRLRAERRFPSAQALQRQIGLDFKKARRWARENSLQNRSVSIQ